MGGCPHCCPHRSWLREQVRATAGPCTLQQHVCGQSACCMVWVSGGVLGPTMTLVGDSHPVAGALVTSRAVCSGRARGQGLWLWADGCACASMGPPTGLLHCLLFPQPFWSCFGNVCTCGDVHLCWLGGPLWILGPAGLGHGVAVEAIADVPWGVAHVCRPRGS